MAGTRVVSELRSTLSPARSSTPEGLSEACTDGCPWSVGRSCIFRSPLVSSFVPPRPSARPTNAPSRCPSFVRLAPFPPTGRTGPTRLVLPRRPRTPSLYPTPPFRTLPGRPRRVVTRSETTTYVEPRSLADRANPQCRGDFSGYRLARRRRSSSRGMGGLVSPFSSFPSHLCCFLLSMPLLASLNPNVKLSPLP
jgi:hypothetical protein